MASKPKSDIARATKAALRASRPDDRGLLHGDAQSFDVAVRAASVERAATIIDRLIGLLKGVGLPAAIEQVDYRTKRLKLDGEPIRLRLAGALDRTRHLPAKEERERAKVLVDRVDALATGAAALAAASAEERARDDSGRLGLATPSFDSGWPPLRRWDLSRSFRGEVRDT